MKGFFKIAALVGVIAASAVLALSSRNSAIFLAWPRAQNFVPVAAENGPFLPTPPVSSQRVLDREAEVPSPGLMAETLIAEQGGSAFPILLPLGFAATSETLAATRLRLRLLDDGYYAVFQSVHMEITLVGTATAWHGSEDALFGNQADIQADIQENYVKRFEDPGPIPAGGAITFGHFGADYSVTFDCVNTNPGLKRNCITKEAAEAFVANLAAGTATALEIPPFVSS